MIFRSVGGFLLSLLVPHFFANTTDRTDLQIAFAGLIVGFGTVLGSGCTSGHGICGIARLSPRSIIATAVFMIVGIVTATALKYFEALL